MGAMLESCSVGMRPPFILGLKKGLSRRRQGASEKNTAEQKCDSLRQ